MATAAVPATRHSDGSAASPLRGLRLALQTGSAVIGLYHMQVAVGRLMAEFGLVNEQYRNPESN